MKTEEQKKYGIKFTERNKEICDLLRAGKSAKELGKQFSLSEKYIYHIAKKEETYIKRQVIAANKLMPV